MFLGIDKLGNLITFTKLQTNFQVKITSFNAIERYRKIFHALLLCGATSANEKRRKEKQ